MFSAKSFSEERLRYVPSVARFLAVAFQGPMLWTLLFFVRLQYVAMTRFSYFLLFRAFFSVTFLALLHVSDPECGVAWYVWRPGGGVGGGERWRNSR